MLISMVVIFALCWFPFNALNMMRDFHLDKPIKHLFSFLFLLAHVISMSATCWNPILYAWMNENFRREFKAALPCCFSKVERVNETTLTRMGSQYRSTVDTGD
uniref:G-protein coupled receptors family 1 profile domain-containing protein n=1 Tax=Plectus sambesii TaxID=2011161 RepID=A0A914VSW0_9BILA